MVRILGTIPNLLGAIANLSGTSARYREQIGNGKTPTRLATIKIKSVVRPVAHRRGNTKIPQCAMHIACALNDRCLTRVTTRNVVAKRVHGQNAYCLGGCRSSASQSSFLMKLTSYIAQKHAIMAKVAPTQILRNVSASFCRPALLATIVLK